MPDTAAAPTVPAVKFTAAEAESANDEWGFNCGPAAVAVMTGLTIEEVRPHLGDFEQKRYTNPTLMFEILRSIGVKWKRLHSPDIPFGWDADDFPQFGLVRIQWEGPWTEPGVPIAARYRHTHWIGAMKLNDEIGVFDLNCCKWVKIEAWVSKIVPWILEECVPRANGRWHVTHTIEIMRRN